MTIEEILAQGKSEDVIKSLKQKTTIVPPWSELMEDYDPTKHAIVADATLRPKDKKKAGFTDKVSKITYSAEKINTRRMLQMGFTIPVERTYNYDETNKTLKEVAEGIEAVYSTARIDGVNVNRMRAYFAACEVCTIWYLVEAAEPHEDYGFPTKFKMRCRSYSPMDSKMSHISQANLYPLFDEYDDMIAMSIEYTRKEGDKSTTYFECYTPTKTYKWKTIDGKTEDAIENAVPIGKIQCVYLSRPAPIYDGIANSRNEIEFALSRQSDIIRKNSAPMIKVIGKMIESADKPVSDVSKEIYNIEQGGDVDVITPSVSVESTAFFVAEMHKNIEEETQLPNLSMENTKGLGALSGEARKTLLTDAHMKVGEEKHPIIWSFDRECNIIKALLGHMNVSWKEPLKQVKVKHDIIPFVQNDEEAKAEKIAVQVSNGYKSRRTAIAETGDVDDVDAELAQIQKEEKQVSQNNSRVDIFNTGV